MDGDFNRTLPKRLTRCDTVIYLDFNRVTCLLSWAKRVITNWGKARADMAPGCKEWFDPEFARWLWNFNKLNGNSMYRLLNETEGVEKMVLKNRRAVRKFLQSI